MNGIERTPLYDLHLELGAKMVDFAGSTLPIQYAQGIIHEHRHTRTQASLFDVSHMVQLRLAGDAAARALETLVSGNIIGLPVNRQRYTLLTNSTGGIIDDLMVTNQGDALLLVVNAARGDEDLAHLRDGLPAECTVERLDRALLALQGPAAAEVMERYLPAASLKFLHTTTIVIQDSSCFVSRSGYTGEDGFEIAVANESATSVARALLAHPAVKPAGLGARDSLRLEAGLCLYGNDLDVGTSIVAAGLQWTIAPVRRAGGERAGGFPGADVLNEQLEQGVARRRVGLRVDGKAVARQGAKLLWDDKECGIVTSGGFSPSLGAPIAMAYVDSAAQTGTQLTALVRNKKVPVTVTALPFLPPNYFRG